MIILTVHTLKINSLFFFLIFETFLNDTKSLKYSIPEYEIVSACSSLNKISKMEVKKKNKQKYHIQHLSTRNILTHTHPHKHTHPMKNTDLLCIYLFICCFYFIFFLFVFGKTIFDEKII